MATFRVDKYIDFLTKGYHDATTWQVALDPNFEHVIDESIHDKVNIKEWKSMLPKIGESGHYADLDALYCRIKIHMLEDVSDWYVMEPKNQNNQTIEYTEEGQPTQYYNSLEIGLN